MNIVFISIVSTALAAPPCANATTLDWLAGVWTHTQEGTTTEERWSPPQAGSLIGSSRTMKPTQTVFFEHLMVQTQPDGCLAYVAWPGGGTSTTFVWAGGEARSVVFENAVHDWPQRICYTREGDILTAVAEDLAQTRQLVLTLARQP